MVLEGKSALFKAFAKALKRLYKAFKGLEKAYKKTLEGLYKP